MTRDMKWKLNENLLADQNPSQYSEEFNNCYNARGLYNSMQFVLRLRPDLHAILDKVSPGVVTMNKYDFETIQAFSTYLHETIHWWQHVGSISGLILSFAYPAQTHINIDHLKDYLKQTGLIKPVTRYNSIYATEYRPQGEFATINIIINNFFDIEFFKYRMLLPQSVKSFANDPLFESIGHSYSIAYAAFINLLSSTFDRESKFLPNLDVWEKEFRKLKDDKVEGYYYGSQIGLPPVGLAEIFEGQARFIQLQYLYFGSGGNLTWDDFEELGMLSEKYYSAFSWFLTLTESERPESVDSPLVALFLLVLDLSMNPTEGFPFGTFDHKFFVDSVDPGMRFMLSCFAIRDKHQELKTYIQDYSNNEYVEAVRKLSESLVCPSPLDSASRICEWSKSIGSLSELMKESETFQFGLVNMPIRLMFSQFIQYQEDKLNNPAFFCWTGVYCAGEKLSDEATHLFLKHQSLFSDKADGDIYPRLFPDKNEEIVQETFNTFYTWIITYDLCRQWIVNDGNFEYDYFWITSKYSRDELKEWARSRFASLFEVDPETFKFLDQHSTR